MSLQWKSTVILAVLLVAGLCVAGSESPRQASDQRLLDLEACIATLEERVEELESRVDLLTPAAVQWHYTSTPIPPDGSKPPPGAVPFRFNGMTYYYMPVSSR